MKNKFLLALVCTPLSLFGAITGQWDFETDLSATLGQPMSFLDSETETGSQFGTTTALGIPNINGQPARVMRFPSPTSAFGGYYVPHGALANGGGAFVNQYTIIMDVLFPAASADKLRALVQTDNTDDAEFFVAASGGVGIKANNSFLGRLSSNTWHRISLAVDLSLATPTADVFIDGTKAGSVYLSAGDALIVDSHWALTDSYFMLFQDDDL